MKKSMFSTWLSLTPKFFVWFIVIVFIHEAFF
jgi:hypothetical protein